MRRLNEILYELRRPSAKRWMVLVLMTSVGLICWLDLATGSGREPVDLYNIPILISTVTFGMIGVLYTATTCSIVYLLTLWIQHAAYYYEDAVNVLLLYLLGVVAAQLIAEYLGAVKSREKLHILNLQLEERVADALAAEHEAQQKLRDAQRLTMLGEAASHIAHEIKNPLVSIGGFARRIQKQIPDEHPAHSGLQVITREVARLETMLKELLDFSSPGYCECLSIDVAALVHDVFALAQPLAQGQLVQLIYLSSEKHLSTVGDPNQLKRALFNVVLNGVQAMPKGGKLSVEATSSSNSEGCAVKLIVRDTGPGIPSDILPRIFEPFFTTRQYGTGLGLALAKKTVNAHGGSIHVESAPNMGTSVTICFPGRLPSTNK